MSKEEFFISLFKNKFIGDDGAVVGRYIFTKDLFCEDVHFKKEWMSLKQIAYKSMIVNISDAVVMNAKPRYALLGIKIPSNFSKKDLRELRDGFCKACKMYDISIIGGDTVSGDKLDISITLISYSKKPIFRRGIRYGHLLAYTGVLGRSKKDLKKLLQGGKVSHRSKFINPKLKEKFFYKASKYISSSLDISDGLYKDLSRVTKINRVGVKFFKNFTKEIACSGEEYEVLFAFDKRYKHKILSIAKKSKTSISIFAKAKRGKFVSKCKENHFNPYTIISNYKS